MNTQAKGSETSADTRIEVRHDDEHGRERPWIALLDGKYLRNKRGALRTFTTPDAARKAAASVADALDALDYEATLWDATDGSSEATTAIASIELRKALLFSSNGEANDQR
jgi:chemotaxis regulatin CheY-phosphate phosphatase CheZ